MTFEKQIESLSEVARKKMLEAQDAVSDGRIIFIDDSDMIEYYSLTGIYQRLGRR